MNWEAVIRQARECHTKQAWEALFDAYGDALAASSNSKPIQEVYKTLRADPQSLQYEPRIWGNLIQGCLASWNLELGREIIDFAKRLASPLVNIPAAKLFLESGLPSAARDVANRTLRLTGLQAAEKLQLEMMVASSFAEEGKRQKTIRLLNQVRTSVESAALGTKERADFLTSMARMQFLLGRYSQTAELFYEASRLYRELGDWEAAAKSIFNTAVCNINGGTKRQDEAFAMIEECRRLSEAHNLHGPLSHCEAAYGTVAYYRGDFARAREYLRRALEYLPISDRGPRRLQILSMLSYTYLAMGRFHLARKFGQQTLVLAALDESDRFKTRYTNLKAELTWEDGLIDESQSILRPVATALESHGVHTLEELSTMARYSLQSALLDQKPAPVRVEIDDALKKNHHSWLEYLWTQGQLALNADAYSEAEKSFTEALNKARQMSDRYHEAVGLLGLIQSQLRQRRPTNVEALFRELEMVIGWLGETPLKSHALIIHAALAYQRGDYSECERVLKQSLKSPRQGFAERFVIGAWTSTIEGRSSRLTADWQTNLLARYTRTYFAPSLEAVDERHFMVSGRYLVSLERHPSLAELLHYLLLKPHFRATTAEIQTHVWKQSLQTQGWQQKIRNTIMRLRDFFPQTIAPLIVHEGSISLFSQAIAIQAPRQAGIAAEDEIIRLIGAGPMSSQELAGRLQLSPATTKRILKRLTDESVIHAVKHGRNVRYLTAVPGHGDAGTQIP